MDLILKHEVDRILSRDPDEAALAHELLVDYLEECGFVTSAALSRALRLSPRHLFLPGSDLHVVYQDRAVTTSRDDSGWFDSSCSTPSIVAAMTEALGVEEGDRILELGTGTGWTAAIMARIAPDVRVTTLEVLPEIADGSRDRLREMGLDQVEVRRADGSGDTAGPGPYDKIIFACGAQSVPWPIVDLLVDGGRLVIPVGDFVHVFEKRGNELVGHPALVATFIAFQDGRATRSWHPIGDRAVLCPESLKDSAASLVSDAFLPVGTMELDAGQIETLLYFVSMRAPDACYLLAGRDHGSGFGIVDPKTQSAAALYCESAFTFRHYRSQLEEAQVAVLGGNAAGERLLAICEEVAGLGWPRLDELRVRVSRDASAEGEDSWQRAEEGWTLAPLAPQVS